MITIRVKGKPIPQGSKTAFVVKGRAVVTDANAKLLKPWRKHVAATAREQYTGQMLTGALQVTLLFLFERPASVTRKYPSVKPDVDKVTRAIFDAMTDAGVWKDDALVVDTRQKKEYAATAGVVVTIKEID
ncbi:RusA family crossover junction endodeoxyribonuclease [Lysinibacter cavernae]|uniref:Holliday junction resolvase RusA-like endonuclease n=1 Tax=Lysinibacter cavernae TaxID=1640652 RepID=A0A7X5QZ86_9MICO|nr:RusA family crossover junction endodeoxyribonuclease [Lysinibacter cavernae]NIH52517.1 Holliday junction resolvase RusA-like endonuclease [Lysinibacter cavernae]